MIRAKSGYISNPKIRNACVFPHEPIGFAFEQFTSIPVTIMDATCIARHSIENIVITELRVAFSAQDLTLVQSEMVVLGVLGYSRTQHAEWHDQAVLSVSGYGHLKKKTVL